jgi:biopolymer transport protein ExbB
LTLLAALFLITERWRYYRKTDIRPDFGLEVLSLCADKRFDEAKSLCSNSRGVVAHTLGACLKAREQGQEAMEDAIQEQLLSEQPRLQRGLGGLAMLGAVSPLLGLLGTVSGIVRTFTVIKLFGSTDPGHLSGGIAEALVATEAGLIIAIPVVLAHSALSGKMDRIMAEAEKHAAALINLLVHNAEKAESGAGAPPPRSDRPEGGPAPKAEYQPG